jgi:hypothetical protein
MHNVLPVEPELDRYRLLSAQDIAMDPSSGKENSRIDLLLLLLVLPTAAH